MGFVRRLLFTKSFAALVLAGFTCAYMVLEPLAGLILRQPFSASMPFIFILQGIGLAVIVAVLRDHLFAGPNVAKWHLVSRVLVCAVVLAVALGLCLLIFFAFHTDWAKLWLIVAFLVLAGVLALLVLAEITGKPKPAAAGTPAGRD